MYRNSDNSDSTASSRTHVTGQTGKKPGEGIFSQQNNTTNAHHDAKFDSIEIPVCVRQKRSSASNGGAARVTSQIPRAPKAYDPRSSTGSYTRTGSVPYLYADSEQRRRAELSRTRTTTNAVPRVPSRKKKKVHPLLALILNNRKTVVTCALLVLCISIIVPLAVYAAVYDGGSDSADFEMLGTAPAEENVLDAEGVYLENVGNDSVSSSFEENTMPDTLDTSESSDPSETDEAAPEETTEADESTEATEATEETEEIEDPEETTEETETEEPEEIPEEPPVPAGFKVTVQFYDRELLTCTTGPTTLRQILEASGIWLTENEHPSVGLDDPIEYESWITVDKTEYKQVTESEAIPYSSETVNVTTVPRGTYQTATYGKNGVRDTVYTVEYLNGVEVNRTKEYDYIALYPTNEVVYYGVGGTFTAPDGNVYSYSYCMDVRATYYNIHGTTASGMPTGHNVIATDPNVFPLGTRMYVFNDTFDMGIRIAADTGGAVKGNLIDIWMDETSPYYEQFAAQGVWSMKVYVLD